MDVVAADPEVAAGDAGYARALADAGFHAIDEIQPSRHRMALALPADGDADAVLADVAKATRQRIRRAERDGVAVLRWDARAAGTEREGLVTATEAPETALGRFFGLLRATGERRGFGFAGPDEFVAWWLRALAAGHLVYLEAREGAPDGDVLGGLVLYRHGDRLSTAHSADRAERRHDHPGAMHLLRWRAIELALAEGRTEMDLGGADVAGARREPAPGEPTHGLYEHKRSFGATWVALAGAQEHVARAWRYAAGRTIARAGRAVGRGTRRVTGSHAETGSETAIDRLLAAAEPASPRPLAGLIDRLRAGDLVRGARRDDLPIGAAALRDVEVTGADRRLACGPARVAVRRRPGLPRRRPRLRDPGRDRGRRRGTRRAPGRGDRPAAARGVRLAGRARPGGGLVVRRPVARPGHDRDHRHRRQDHDLVPRRRGARGRGRLDGPRSGTIETKVGAVRDRHAAHVTTPGAPELQQALAAMARAGNAAAVLEATSHALALDRVLGVAWDAAVFTNLTHEHLELHGTFEAYRAAKLRLFRALGGGPDGDDNPAKTVAGRPWPKVAVVNRDDPAAAWFEAAAHEAGATVVTYGADAAATVRATAVEEDARRLRVAYAAPSGNARLELRLAGRFNAHNALAVVALGEGLGLDPAAVRTGLESVEGVPGRMERIDAGQPFAVVVDYAHSPASLQAVLELLAPVAAAGGGGVIAVFGSAGERDTTKRAVMGRIAAERCRLVVVTDEDPRGEDRDAIVLEIVRGAQAAGGRAGVDVLAIADRRAAIAEAFERAAPGDVVLLAGKGHEASILYADGPIPWDEAAVAREALAALGYGGR